MAAAQLYDNSPALKNDHPAVVPAEKKPEEPKVNKLPIDRWPFLKRFNSLKNEAMNGWYPMWKELVQFINPTRGFFMDDIPNRGRKIDHRVFLDSTPEIAARTLASGMSSGLTSPARPWFRLEIDDALLREDEEVKIWCDLVQTLMLGVFAKSNIYGVLHTMYEEVSSFGTACAFIEEDFKDVIRAHVYTIGEYYIACDPKGRPNAFARSFWMTVSQLVEEFGIENVSPQTKQAFENHSTETWVMVSHLIESNDKRIPGIKDFRNMPIRSLYWENGSAPETYLRLGGYEEMPVLIPRWETTTTADSYGKGTGWKALGDSKMLQKNQRQVLTALDKVIDPPTQQDTSVEGDANTLPGGTNRYSALTPNAGIKPAYQIQPDIEAMERKIEKTQGKINSVFYADLFLMLINADMGKMTAYEVAERQSEKLQVLGPVLERLENELLSPLINRTYQIMVRNGMIPEPPQKIKGAPIKINYVSILAQAQKMVGSTSIQQVFGFAGNVATVKPEVLDNLDGDEAIRSYADMLQIPAKIIVPKEKVAAGRKEKAKAQAAAQQQQQAMAAGKTGKDVAGAIKDLGNAPVSGNSALAATLSGIGSG